MTSVYKQIKNFISRTLNKIASIKDKFQSQSLLNQSGISNESTKDFDEESRIISKK